jgi:signal transduction histidine kinase
VLTAALRQEQLARARRAVDEERLRIARELHDVVAHHMSVVSVQAGLARYVFAADPSTARTAVETIADTAQEALEEMRRLVALLRVAPGRTGPSGDAPDMPAPSLGALTDLIERVRAAGVDVDLDVTGTPRALSSGLDLCAFRVIQESLTNVLKHAPDAHALVRLEYDVDQLVVQVTNDGPTAVIGQDHDADENGGSAGPTGHGLIGMRERARLYGGSLRTGPLAAGGFEVTLTLPLGPWDTSRSSTASAGPVGR